MKTLIAADGSSYAKRMLAFLAAHEEWFGPKHQYTVTHSMLAVHRAASYGESESSEIFIKPMAKRRSDRFGPCSSSMGSRTFVHMVGDAADSCANLAEEDKFDLSVMGSRVGSRLVNLLLGSAVTKVQAKGSTPSLLVR